MTGSLQLDTSLTSGGTERSVNGTLPRVVASEKHSDATPVVRAGTQPFLACPEGRHRARKP